MILSSIFPSNIFFYFVQIQNWKPNGQVIVPPPKTLQEIEDSIFDASCEKVDFYPAKKQ